MTINEAINDLTKRSNEIVNTLTLLSNQCDEVKIPTGSWLDATWLEEEGYEGNEYDITDSLRDSKFAVKKCDDGYVIIRGAKQEDSVYSCFDVHSLEFPILIELLEEVDLSFYEEYNLSRDEVLDIEECQIYIPDYKMILLNLLIFNPKLIDNWLGTSVYHLISDMDDLDVLDEYVTSYEDADNEGSELSFDIDDYEDQYKAFLDEAGTVTVAGCEFDPSQILEECDPTAFRCGLNDYADPYLTEYENKTEDFLSTMKTAREDIKNWYKENHISL